MICVGDTDDLRVGQLQRGDVSAATKGVPIPLYDENWHSRFA
jgi:hypothetical protein